MSFNKEEIEEIFLVGKIFKNFEAVNEAFKDFCFQKHHPFVTRSRSNKQIIYKCTHGIRQISKSKGKRPNQKYNFTGCEAQINLYKGRDGPWKVTKMNLNHNHEILANRFKFSNRINTNNFKKSKYPHKLDSNDANLRIISKLCQKLINLISSCGKDKIQNYIDEFKVLIHNVENGLPLFTTYDKTVKIKIENFKS